MSADKYIVRVTAGPRYDADSQIEVPVNKPQPIKISTDLADIELNVRIQNYAGLPRQSPETSPYFSTEPHATNNDQYSISFRFTPKKPAGAEGEGISAADLQFGNDFDHPIRDRLPPGFNTAMNIVKWWIDPGLEGDAYADTPYLYGPALSSFNVIHAGAGTYDEEKGGLWFEEGGDEAGLEAREKAGAPATSKERMKWALRKESKEQWLFEYGKTYGMDFFNPYLDFSNLALRLPGFQLAIMKYWDGQALREGEPKRSHQLRYVLRNRSTEEVYLVVLFTIHLKTDVNEDGSIKDDAAGHKAGDLPPSTEDKHGPHDEAKALDEAKKQLGPSANEAETNADDVD
ncbi:F-box domain containing protein [Colletotrichum plurivorum]|uniref:F-box domain containing protein n=1 Tax=Colletotrichum plurivorum TaxID=2175906 RepID=A0A8H6KGR1_9PEZI|nr:F-box domain containing protein [Colletotrichum plurivorum]